MKPATAAAAAWLACCQSAAAAPAPAAAERAATLPRPCQSVATDAPTTLVLGKSRVVPLPFPAVRMVVGGQAGSRAAPPMPAAARPGAAAGPAQPMAAVQGVAETEITLISPTELYFLGRRPGAMNVVVQAADGRCLVKDIVVTVDPGGLQSILADLVPQEADVRVRATEGALVLTGTVSDNTALDEVMSIAAPYAGEHRKVVNLLKVAAPQQVMLEVTIAEVSKSVLGHLNVDFTRMVTGADGGASAVISGIFGGGAAVLGRFKPNLGGGGIANEATGLVGGERAGAGSMLSSTSRGSTLLGVDAQNKDGLVRILAEPNIMAISGQSASFLSGGKIFIPVAQSRDGLATTMTLEEKEFGVGLKFTPTVLGGSRINLKLVSEASQLQQTGSPFATVNGTTAILPSLSTRRVDTTVQLHDGQSFMVAGLIKNNTAGALDKFPGLGEMPVMGALFRSTEFQNDQTELMFIVTPRLVKPMQSAPTLPTDNHAAPSRGDVLFRGTAEGNPAPPARP